MFPSRFAVRLVAQAHVVAYSGRNSLGKEGKLGEQLRRAYRQVNDAFNDAQSFRLGPARQVPEYARLRAAIRFLLLRFVMLFRRSNKLLLGRAFWTLNLEDRTVRGFYF